MGCERLKMHSKILLYFLALTLGLFAIEGDISVYLVEKERYFVSEEVVVKIDLKTDAFSITNAKIRLENSQDYVVLAPKSASSLKTVDINGTQWQVVHYEYKLYPLHAGNIGIPPFDISFNASMGYGQPDNNFTFQSDAIALEVSAPKGAEKDDFVLSTPHYSLQSGISPKLSEGNATKIKVGDAIELKITQEAKNVPDILLRPIRFSEDVQFKIYSEEPILESKAAGSDTIATRTDSFTFVAVKEGNVSIPSQTFIWWDPAGEVLHTEKTHALHFIILPNSQPTASNVFANEVKQDDKPWVFIILLACILLIAFYKIYPSIKRWRERQELAYKQSEEGCFKSLLDACQKDNINTLYHNFYSWLQVSSPTLSRLGFRGIGEAQPSFSESLRELEAALSDKQKTFDTIGFMDELKKLRDALLKEQKNNKQSLPKNINPL